MENGKEGIIGTLIDVLQVSSYRIAISQLLKLLIEHKCKYIAKFAVISYIIHAVHVTFF